MKLIDTSDLSDLTSQLNSEKTINDQILTRCLEVQNRFYENKDEKHKKCLVKPAGESKCQEENSNTSQNYEERKERVDQILNGDIELLSKLQDFALFKRRVLFPQHKKFSTKN